ncbi:superoxide dismutase family protein [Nucisporomicrobium flavum]|uniref:superoxide dismutase family protein n=1 Tax=Nucisporomicrobium flavum TaxID=2785915 RepID=UPI0018F7BEE8|nr:superoxide dismutase family protein [Nucisporomicrobium flavum]
MRLALPLVTALVAALAGCADTGGYTPAGVTAQPPPPGTPFLVTGGGSPAVSPGPSGGAPLSQNTTSGTFLPSPQGTRAITYDPAVVPPGATAEVTIDTTTQSLRVRLQVTGMVPRRSYGAHLHTASCTSVPDDAGPHYQHDIAPSKPSTDPVYANPQNEVWLDFTADLRGAATVTSVQDWTIDPVRPPHSLVIHAERTRTGKDAGTAGPRVACLTLPA